MVQAPPGRHLRLISGSRLGRFFRVVRSRNRTARRRSGPESRKTSGASGWAVGPARALRELIVEADTMAIKDWLAYAVAVSAGVLVTMLLGHIRW